ncbi:MAG: hypothetical protein PVF65_01020 [Sphingomonadales bacterium]
MSEAKAAFDALAKASCARTPCPCGARPFQPPTVFVHGHYQCTICGLNVVPCCNGETAVMSAAE